jgi:hypothetical protein
MTSVSIQAAGYKEGSIPQLCRLADYSTRPTKFKLRHYPLLGLADELSRTRTTHFPATAGRDMVRSYRGESVVGSRKHPTLAHDAST